MKWLYRLMRLWKCPHRWEDAGYRIREYRSGMTLKAPVLRCRRCGALKVVRG